ncbi:MAG: lathosterol oxidase [Saprospiraceae bacterium]|jgi:lathosterol oxidase
MHPIEHVMFLGAVLIHFVVPANPLIIVFLLMYYARSAATSHAGYDCLYVKKGNRTSLNVGLGNFHHQMHHAYFDCHYGCLEIPWDKWFGFFHDGTEGSHQQFMAKRKANRSK